MSIDSLLELASKHHGLLRTEDASGHGIGRTRLDRMCESGLLERLGHLVYRVRGAPRTWEQTVLAACWRVGPAAQASHRTAAALLELQLARRSVLEVLVPLGMGARIPGVMVHQTRHLRAADSSRVGCIPTTSPERTVVDMSWLGPVERTERMLDHAVHLGLTTSRRVADHLGSMPTRGRRGATALWELLAERTGDPNERANAWENLMSRLLRASDLPVPDRQHQVRIGEARYYLDFAFPDHKVAVECDSAATHLGGAALFNDLHRQHAIEEQGWVFKRFVKRQVTEDPAGSVRKVRELLVDRGWSPDA